MKNITLLFSLLLIGLSIEAKTLLKDELQLSRKQDYSEKEMSRFLEISYLLEEQIFENHSTNFKENLQNIKKDTQFHNTLKSNITSQNTYRQTIGFRLASILNDTSLNYYIRQHLTTEIISNVPDGNPWGLSSLAINSPTSTDLAFAWLIKYEDLGDPHSLPYYMLMDTSSIIKTGYDHLEDTNLKSKIIALESICMLDKTMMADSTARNAIRTWDNRIKGYAIQSLAFCKKGNYKEILSQYIDTPSLREIIIVVLESSPDKKDIEYAKNLKQVSIPVTTNPEPARTKIPMSVSNDVDTSEVFYFPDIDAKPLFTGGNLKKYIQENIRYKEQLEEAVTINIIIKKDGSIDEPRISNSAGNKLLEDEAMRLVKNMPKWEPGIRDGQPVNVVYSIPFSFRLKL